MKRILQMLQRLQREDGSALIELALIVPLITTMLVGVVNYGMMLQQDMQVADSARAGAEYALTPGNQTNTAQMATVATTSAGSVPGYSAVAVNVCTCAPGSAAVSCTSFCPAYGQPALYAQVTATAALPLFFNSAITRSVSSVVRVRISCPGC